ncbi:MAG: hypothetical protein FD143_1108 [Ignavibacteria bacterium]|nr:MAG: hypothetical protein FD143_1108 [Ignavibacteria bacterium]KAF0161038.1 MAG: hypothetical protein FD188_1259 [Ignavibacteria bacterium]
MSDLVQILLVLLIITATALCVYLILVLKKLVVQLNDLQKDIKQLVDSTIPVLKNLNEVTLRANRIVSSAENYWQGIERSIENVRMKFSNFTSVGRFDGAEYPARNLVQNIKAFYRGFTTFWQELRK